jgi:hypothetical protein
VRGRGHAVCGSEEALEMTIVMGLDQHRAQITAEWIDTETGEVMRSRISPAHRAGVRRFRERFREQELEVCVGGNDRLAVRGRRVPAGRGERASRRAC